MRNTARGGINTARKTDLVFPKTASVEANSPKSSGEKKFCTHFVRKNQCDYRGQGKGKYTSVSRTDNVLTVLCLGCKYQHEFVEGHPDTREMLKLFGLSEIPPWCRVKENDKSITPSAGNPLPARVWRPESREHSVPQGVPVEWTAPHCVASAGLDSAGRYASGSASPGHHHHHHHHHRQPHQSQPAARPRAQPQPQPQSAKDPYVLAGRSQFFRSLSHFDGEDVFSGIIPLQPTNRTERAVNHEVGVDGKSPWATQANQENINPNSMRFNSAAPEQTGNRGRRLYQPRTTNEVSQNQPRPMHEHNRRSDSAAGRHSAPIPQSASPPLGSRPPSRMSEVNSSYYSSPFLPSSGFPYRPTFFSYGHAMAAPARRPHLALEADHYVREKKVKQNNDHTQNHNMSMFVNMSEPSSANGLASRAATPDSNDPFGLIKFD